MALSIKKDGNIGEKIYNMHNKLILILAAAFVLLNGLIGHFFAPAGMYLTPVIITITSCLVIFALKNTSLIVKSIGVYFFIGFNDIFIKLYAGGNHDMAGQGWILFYALIGIAITTLFLLINLLITKNEKNSNRITSLILFFILLVIHYFLFANLGIGRSY